MTKCKVAVVQAGSIVMNKEKCIDKAVDLIQEAGEQGANIIVFPEAYIPAYPRGMSFGAVVGSRTPEGRDEFLRYSQNAITVPGPETDRLGEAVKKVGAYVVMGVIERDSNLSGGTLCARRFSFGPTNILGKHRKLKPTGSERLIWGEGDGSTLPVFDTPYGKIGAVICWENYMPLLRTAMYEKGIQIYIAPTADHRILGFLRCAISLALEGRCFVLSCNQYSTKDMYEEDLLETEDIQKAPFELTRGGSCIINPLGEFLVEPVFGKEEILYADLDLDDITRGHYDFDVVGHYNRRDIFKLIVNEEKQ